MHDAGRPDLRTMPIGEIRGLVTGDTDDDGLSDEDAGAVVQRCFQKGVLR